MISSIQKTENLRLTLSASAIARIATRAAADGLSIEAVVERYLEQMLAGPKNDDGQPAAEPAAA